MRNNSGESKLDLAFLYSDPLLLEIDKYDPVSKKTKKILIDFNEPLEADQEFDGIITALRKTKRNV